MNAREAVFISLKKYENNKKYANIEADATISKYRLEGADKALYTALFFGTVERKLTLDYFLSLLSERPLEKIAENVLIILRMGLYQLYFMDKIPEFAIVDESVKLAERFSSKASKGFVNGILRNAIRMGEPAYPKRSDDLYGYLSIAYSIPRHLCEKWGRDYGDDTVEYILSAISKPTPMTLRVNTLINSKDALAQKLGNKNIPYTFCAYAPNGIKMLKSIPISELGFIEGQYFVQDEASQICVEACGAQEGDTVMDICACPGSKSFGMALNMRNRGRIICRDLHKNKLSLIERSAKLYGIDIIEVEEYDGSKTDENYISAADVVLCDVPCSGFGTIAKKPDIRYKEPSAFERLPSIQYDILCASAPYVKVGGTLVYSTCTLNPEENEKNVEKFLKNNKGFEKAPFSVGNLNVESGDITLFPHIHNTDGFYICKLKRTK